MSPIGVPILSRTRLTTARDDTLFFAQVREDPLVEIEALHVRAGDRVAVVTSGGCTALSLLARQPELKELFAVDLNTSQNHLFELKIAAVRELGNDVVEFLGGSPSDPARRQRQYETLRFSLTPSAQCYWDDRAGNVGAGVIVAGRSEQLLRVIIWAMRNVIHSDAKLRQLFDARTLHEQRRYYDTVWNNRRWRWYLRLFVNRLAFRKTLHPAFFEHVENPDFAAYFQGVIEHVLTSVPIRDNYFFRQMITGYYGEDDAMRPPYLQSNGMDLIRRSPSTISVVDAAFTEFLRSQADGSLDVFALSNIVEWMDEQETHQLFGEIVRTAAPGARLVFRNFVGWTEIPEAFSNVIVEDEELGKQLIAGDRSGMQRRAAVCTIGSR